MPCIFHYVEQFFVNSKPLVLVAIANLIPWVILFTLFCHYALFPFCSSWSIWNSQVYVFEVWIKKFSTLILNCVYVFVICVGLRLKHPPAMWETWVRSLDWEDPLGKEMAIHSSILAWRIPWTEEPGGLQSTGSRRVGHDYVTSLTHS